MNIIKILFALIQHLQMYDCNYVHKTLILCYLTSLSSCSTIDFHNYYKIDNHIRNITTGSLMCFANCFLQVTVLRVEWPQWGFSEHVEIVTRFYSDWSYSGCQPRLYIEFYSACASRQSHVADCQNVINSWVRCDASERIHTEFRPFLLQIYFGMLARIKMCYTVIIRMCCIRL